MNNEERKIANRKRCLACPNYGRNACPLFAEADTFDLDKCIKEYDFYKNIQIGSLEEHLIKTNPISLLQYVSKSRPLNVGDIVITLKGGFGTFRPGKMLKVIDIEERQTLLKDVRGVLYCVSSDDYYLEVFKMDFQTFEEYKK